MHYILIKEHKPVYANMQMYKHQVASSCIMRGRIRKQICWSYDEIRGYIDSSSSPFPPSSGTVDSELNGMNEGVPVHACNIVPH